MKTCKGCGTETYFSVGFCSKCQDVGIYNGNVDTLIDLALRTGDKVWFMQLARQKRRWLKKYEQNNPNRQHDKRP